ncbi:two-component system sensor histidine kinase RegB [Albidovulum inexpectatum]|uniref:histidine kinase n=2 Tax=Albidovulum inexpectatum TaxID=196587 RepID=A0A2S5JMI2_9RHOB|nr:two-component system sensor histidine kinase RegB [Albidovulum inexpectatum]
MDKQLQPSLAQPVQMTPRISDWVRLRTLVMLRWAAICGQSVAILVAARFYGVSLNLPAVLSVVGAAVFVNLATIYLYPRNKRLSEREAMAALLFDTVQLGVLLGLTGGLSNPFALLILAPATIAATALGSRAAMIVGGSAILLVTAIAFVHLPLRLQDGTPLAVPPLFQFGFWLALVIGIVFQALYARRVASEIQVMNRALLATQMALAREQKLTDLGGVVAATAHELGTPLATIKLVSTELARELADDPELAQDAALIAQQADRCRDILRSMGRAGKDDLHLRRAPLSAVIREAAEPHADRGKEIIFDLGESGESARRQPVILRRPEIIHGLRNLIQNAVDFARHRVWVESSWSSDTITVTIADDGAGYPVQILDRIGEPDLRLRREDGLHRPGYEGMGLGLFIAKTLLEHTGARLRFANGSDPFLTESERPDRSGAIVTVTWPRRVIEATDLGALGENRPIAE